MTDSEPAARTIRAAFGAAVFVLAALFSACGVEITISDDDSDGTPPAAFEDGIAVAIVYDTSGSMNEPTKLRTGGFAQKYVVANDALRSIIDRLESWAKGGSPGSPRRVDAGLYVFSGDEGRAVVPMGPLDARSLRDWVGGFEKPDGPTPLGETLAMAGRAVLRSRLSKKHVLVVTDGESNRGLTPAKALGKLSRLAGAWKTSVSTHVVAFDVNAAVFEAIKAQGATLLSASNEAQLNEQLTFLLEKKILLEDEEPAGSGSGMSTTK